MKFCIIISYSPSTSLSQNAFELSKEIISSKEEISLIFFQGDGVYHTLRSNNKDDSEWHDWLNLLKKNNIRLINCSSASIKRGIKLPQNSPIETAGLGELIVTIQNSDRVIKF